MTGRPRDFKNASHFKNRNSGGETKLKPKLKLKPKETLQHPQRQAMASASRPPMPSPGRKHFVDPGEFLSRFAFRLAARDFCRVQHRPVLIVEHPDTTPFQQLAHRLGTSFLPIAAFRKIREEALYRLHAVGTIGADDAGR